MTMNKQIKKLDNMLFENRLLQELSSEISRRIGYKIPERLLAIDLKKNPRLRTTLARMMLKHEAERYILVVEIQSGLDSKHIMRNILVPYFCQFLGMKNEQLEELILRFDKFHRIDRDFNTIICNDISDELVKKYKKLNKICFNSFLPDIKYVIITEDDYVKEPSVEKYQYLYILSIVFGTIFGSKKKPPLA